MKVYLMTDTGWNLFKGTLEELGPEFEKRNIHIGEGATVGARATVGSNYGIIVMGPIGSRQAMLTGYRHNDQLWIGTGCFIGPATDFEKKVKEVHGDNEHGKAYADALKFLRVRFGKREG